MTKMIVKENLHIQNMIINKTAFDVKLFPP